MTINSLLSEETIANKIYFIRNQKVMLDRDLAILYGIETKRLKEQVKRNISRFPEDFMFELTKSEFENWRSQFATFKFKLEVTICDIKTVRSQFVTLKQPKS